MKTYSERIKDGVFCQIKFEGNKQWKFIISSFSNGGGEGFARVKTIFGYVDVPIDAKNRITILGRKYGESHWHH